MDSRHVLITGSNGFVGRHLVRRLKADGMRVSEVVRRASLTIDPARPPLVLDLTRRVETADLLRDLRPDFVIHLAGTKDRGEKGETGYGPNELNVEIGSNLIDACRALPSLRRFICMGTCDEYGPSSTPFVEHLQERPANSYGASKLAITNTLRTLYREERFPSVILRPSVIFGPGQGREMFISDLVQTLLSGQAFFMSPAEQYRDFVYVEDVVDAISKAMGADEGVDGQVFNIGHGKSWRVREVAMKIAAMIGEDAPSRLKIGHFGYRPAEVMTYFVDIGLAKAGLDWAPRTNMDDGLAATLASYRHPADSVDL